mgnify:CR=1 FL=1
MTYINHLHGMVAEADSDPGAASETRERESRGGERRGARRRAPSPPCSACSPGSPGRRGAPPSGTTGAAAALLPHRASVDPNQCDRENKQDSVSAPQLLIGL